MALKVIFLLFSTRVQICFLLTYFIIFCIQCDLTNSIPLLGDRVRRGRTNEIPFLVAIVGRNKTLSVEENIICSGALVSRQHVLTAAHCMIRRSTNNTRVIVGSNNVNTGKTFNLRGWITYENWANSRNLPLIYESNDVAVLQLKKKVSKNIELGLLSQNTCFQSYGAVAVTAGWGTSSFESYPNFYYLAKLHVLSNTECSRRLTELQGMYMGVDMIILCTIAQPYALIGNGDSGGPLLLDNMIIGINRSTCPFPELPVHPQKVNLHSCVEFYRGFILDVLNT